LTLAHSTSAESPEVITPGTCGPGIERVEVSLKDTSFSPHRHDTYAVGITLSGVQRFGFRGAAWTCLPGQCHVLHPDELHDGRAGTDDGFSYRMVYIDPALIAQVTRGLPFVARPVANLSSFTSADDLNIWQHEDDLDSLAQLDLIETVGRWLTRLSTGREAPKALLATPALFDMRDRIAQDPTVRPTLTELERLSGLDRWTLARQFRTAFGTSPSRFRTCRQIAHAHGLLRSGMPIAQVAADAGFADQSHLSRHFKRTVGISPGRWTSMLPTATPRIPAQAR
jgi:AraC-like DNA-binding protein